MRPERVNDDSVNATNAYRSRDLCINNSTVKIILVYLYHISAAYIRYARLQESSTRESRYEMIWFLTC